MLQNSEFGPPITTIATLLSVKQELLGRPDECPGPNERNQIEQRLSKIDTKLNAVDRPDRLY